MNEKTMMKNAFEMMYVIPATDAEVEEDEELYGNGKLVDSDEYQLMRRTRSLNGQPRVALVEWPTGDRESDEGITHLVVPWQQRAGVESVVAALASRT